MWSVKEEKYLIANYSNTKNETLSKELKMSVKKMCSKAYRLGLKKSKEHVAKMISNRNKIVGRDLNYQNLKEIALKYKSRSEFQKKDSSSYSTARKMGVLDNICSHMISQSFSIPQMIMKNILDKLLKIPSTYNDRKVLKPYEVDVYYDELKLGFEYNGKGWHKNNKRDIFKLNRANEVGVVLIVFNENNRNYESDIKSQLAKQIPKINKLTKLSISDNDIFNIIVDDVYSLVYNFDEMFSIASKYLNKKEFREQNRKIYDKLYKLGKLNEATKYFGKPI